MVPVDFRSRFEGDDIALDPTQFVEQRMPALLDERGKDAGRGAARLGLAPLTLDVEGEQLTFEVVDERLVVRRGRVDGRALAVVRPTGRGVITVTVTAED